MHGRDVDTGGLAPLIAAGGTSVPKNWRDLSGRAAPSSLTLGLSERGRSHGDSLLERVRAVVARLAKKRSVEEDAVRELRRLMMVIPNVVMHVPEFVSYVRWLAQRDLAAVRHIMEVAPQPGAPRPKRRGRPHTSYGFLVRMVDLVRAQEGGSVAKACERLLNELSPSPFAHFTSVKSMENAYASHHELVHATEEFWIPAEELARLPIVLREFT